ncbi:hypothetical protein V2J09_022783 [Rumex salicifolius]
MDGDEKYKATLRCCQEERERRRLQTGMQGYLLKQKRKLPHVKLPLSLSFASKFTAMLETGLDVVVCPEEHVLDQADADDGLRSEIDYDEAVAMVEELPSDKNMDHTLGF